MAHVFIGIFVGLVTVLLAVSLQSAAPLSGIGSTALHFIVIANLAALASALWITLRPDTLRHDTRHRHE